MANFFDLMIERIKEANGGEEDDVLIAFKSKRDELGDNPSQEEVLSAFKSCLAECMAGMGGPVNLSEADKAAIGKNSAVVKEFLDDNNWHYTTVELRSDLIVYELNFSVSNITLRARIFVEADPHVCRVDATFPIAADKTYEYPLCKELAKNRGKRFGSFVYDEEDGEITCVHSWLTRNGIDKTDLDIYFHAVFNTAASAYDDIIKCCVGRFKGKDVTEILNNVNNLVSAISE